MANESKEKNSPSIAFPHDPKKKDWVNSVDPQALAGCLQNLAAGADLDTPANRELVQTVSHNLAKLDAGIVVLNGCSLSVEQKQIVLASMIANPYFARIIARIGALLNQLGGDFQADFSAVQVLAVNGLSNDWLERLTGGFERGDETYASQMVRLYMKLKQNGLLTEQNFKVLKEKIAQPKSWNLYHAINGLNLIDFLFKQIGFDLIILNYELGTAISALHQAGLIKDDKGKNNLKRLMAVGNNLQLAEAISYICLSLNKTQPSCLTQANLDILLSLVKNPVMHGRLRAIGLVMRHKECPSQEMQAFFARLIPSSVITVGEVKKDNKAGNNGGQSLSVRKTHELNKQLQANVPMLPKPLLSLISVYAGNWYSVEDNDQLMLAQKYVEDNDEERIRQHVQQAVCNGWLSVFDFYVKTGHICHNDVLVEGATPSAGIVYVLLPPSRRLVPISNNKIQENGGGRISSYLMLAFKNQQRDMAQLILEYYKDYPNENGRSDHQCPGIDTVEVEWRPLNLGKEEWCCKGSVLHKAIIENDVTLVQSLVTNGANPLCLEQPVGTKIICQQNSLTSGFFQYQPNLNSLLYHAAVLWGKEDTLERRTIFEILIQNLPLHYFINRGEKKLISEMAEKLLLSPPQAASLKAPEGNVGFHKPAPPSGTPALDASPADKKDINP